MVAHECHQDTDRAYLIFGQLIDELDEPLMAGIYYESLKRVIEIARFKGDREKDGRRLFEDG